MAEKPIEQPKYEENVILFGDGNEAIFQMSQLSSQAGFRYFKLRPTPHMEWRNKIPKSHYDQFDRWIHKIYKSDLCYKLSDDSHFQVWMVLCDYYGNENTPLMNHFVRMTEIIKRNRDLEKSLLIARSETNTLRRDLRRKTMFPREDLQEKFNFAKSMKDVMKDPIYAPPMGNFPTEDQN